MRKLILSACAVYVVAVGVIAITLHSAKPGPSGQAIQGVGIGNYSAPNSIAYLSGQRLACARLPAGDAFAERCTVSIADKVLEIRAQRNGPESMNQLGGTCAAFYNEREWPCEMGMRHANVAWFAYISPQLGLSSQDMDVLRQHYWIENLPEQPFINLSLVIAGITTALGLVAVPVLIAPRVQRRSLTALITVYANLMLLPATFILSLWLTAGLWD